MKCECCGKEFLYGNRPDGLPNGVGMQLENGEIIYTCTDCIIKIGAEEDKQKC